MNEPSATLHTLGDQLSCTWNVACISLKINIHNMTLYTSKKNLK